MNPKTTQEFYCGECQGYFLIRLNMVLNFEAFIRCPNCGHEHRRVVMNGEIYEQGRYKVDVKETIRTTKSQYSKEPFTKKMKDARKWSDRRDGVEIDYEMAQRWLNVAARERGED